MSVGNDDTGRDRDNDGSGQPALEPHPLKAEAGEPEKRESETYTSTSQELQALLETFENSDAKKSTIIPLEDLVKRIQALPTLESENQLQFMFGEVNDSLDAIYERIERYKRTVGRHILSFMEQGNLVDGIKPLADLQKRAKYKPEQIDELVRVIALVELPRVYETFEVYYRLDQDRNILNQFRELVNIPVESVAQLRDYMRNLVLDSHEQFRDVIIGQLVGYRISLNLVEDKGCDPYDIRSKILRDIRREDTQASFLLGYAIKMFEFVTPEIRTYTDLTAGNLARSLVDLGNKLLKTHDQCSSSAKDLGIPIDRSKADDLRRRYKTPEGTAFVSRSEIENFLHLEGQVLDQLDGVLANAIKGTPLEGKMGYEEVRARLPGTSLPSYEDLREHTRTGAGERAALQKDVTRFATTPDYIVRSKRAAELQQVFGGVYHELEELTKSNHSELERIRGSSPLFIEYPSQLDVLESINSILGEPTQEAVNQLQLQATVLFEALEVYRLYDTTNALAFGRYEAEKIPGILNEEIKPRLNRRYTTIVSLEGMMSNIDIKIPYPNKKDIFALIDKLVEGKETQRTVQEINSKLAGLYEVIQAYAIIADSRRRVDALKEEFRLEGQLLDRGPDLALQASLAGSTELKEKTHKALIEKRKSLELEEDEGCDDVALLTKVLDGLRGRNVSLKHIVAYAVPIFQESISDFGKNANKACDMWDCLIGFGKKLIESYDRVASVAEGLDIEVDKSKRNQLRTIYESGRIGTLYGKIPEYTESLGKKADEIKAKKKEIEALSDQLQIHTTDRERVSGIDEVRAKQADEKVQELDKGLKKAQKNLDKITGERDKLKELLSQEKDRIPSFVEDLEGVLTGLTEMYPAVLNAVSTYRPKPKRKKAAPRPAAPPKAASKHASASAEEKPALAIYQGEPASYGSGNGALDRLDEVIEAGDRARHIKDTYLEARGIIEEGKGTKQENKRAGQLLESIADRIDVSTELKIIGNLESAKWVAYKAGKAQRPEEKAKLYENARTLLKDALKLEPNFRGALLFLETYAKVLDPDGGSK